MNSSTSKETSRKLKKLSNPRIPDELVEQILFKVPVKSLFRFKSVSKIWETLISGLNSFIDNGNNRTVFLYGHLSSTNNAWVFWVDNHGTFQEYARHHSPMELSFHCSGNGLICFSDDGKNAILWNPSIRRSLILPKSDVNLGGDHRYIFGIVVDQITRKYKILKTDSYGDRAIFEILRVSGDSVGSWEHLDYKPPFLQMYGSQVDLKGVSYWIAVDSDGPMLVSFDGNAELFSCVRIPVPAVVDNETFWLDHELYLFLYEESLVFIHPESDDAVNREIGFSYKIWERDDSEGKTWNLWSKMSFDRSVRPLGFRENGELLWSGDFGYVSLSVGLGFTEWFIPVNLYDGSDIRLPSFVQNCSCSCPNFVESLALFHAPGNNDILPKSEEVSKFDK